jgi:hypothetical protein
MDAKGLRASRYHKPTSSNPAYNYAKSITFRQGLWSGPKAGLFERSASIPTGSAILGASRKSNNAD